MVNYITGGWATKYKYLPDDIRFEGSCEERIQHLKARGYGLYSNVGTGIVYWEQNCSRLKAEEKLLQIQKEEQNKIDEEKRIAESKRVEAKRLADIETARLLAIAVEEENKRMSIVNRDLNTQFRLSQLSLDNKEKIELNLFSQKQDYQELESYGLVEVPKQELLFIPETYESINSIDSMSKQIPLETVTPVLVVLGIGLVSYYLLKENKK
jgi:hypothetical protein